VTLTRQNQGITMTPDRNELRGSSMRDSASSETIVTGEETL